MERYIQYNDEYELAICVACQTGLPNGYVLRHMSEQHKETWKAFQKELREYVGGLSLLPPKELKYPIGPCERVEAISVKDGWICGWHGCIEGAVTKKWVETHCRNNHGKEAAGEKCWYQGRIQTLLGHPYIK
jgi:Orsellinic acid/F9775 biosynthesis cluster protein D